MSNMTKEEAFAINAAAVTRDYSVKPRLGKSKLKTQAKK